MIIAAAISMLLSAQASTAPAHFPQPFVGHYVWESMPNACSDRAPEPHLYIRPTGEQRNQSRGRVTAVRRINDNHIGVDQQVTGHDGTRWTNTILYQLLDDGARLGVTVTRENGARRRVTETDYFRRCP